METWIEIFCLIVFHVIYERKTQSSYTKSATSIVCWLHLLSWYSFHNSSILWFWCALKWQKLYHTNKHILSSTIFFWLQFHFVTSRFIDSFEEHLYSVCLLRVYIMKTVYRAYRALSYRIVHMSDQSAFTLRIHNIVSIS